MAHIFSCLCLFVSEQLVAEEEEPDEQESDEQEPDEQELTNKNLKESLCRRRTREKRDDALSQSVVNVLLV